jgi:hypothetical protein
VFAVSICIGLTSGIAIAGDNWQKEGQCRNDCQFTTEFYLDDCGGFSNTGSNPYFSLNPGYQLILESDEEKAEITVLGKTLQVDGVETRVVEERAYELDDGEEVLVEISENYFAICNRTNDVYYFGELSLECDPEETGGFDDNELLCADGSDPDDTGSFLAGEDGGEAGLIMPGTFLLGAKYFQEQYWAEDPEDSAVDRGENVKMGLTVVTPEGTFGDCVKIIDTNPAEGICKRKDGDPKIYCRGVGLVQDEDLELVEKEGIFSP